MKKRAKADASDPVDRDDLDGDDDDDTEGAEALTVTATSGPTSVAVPTLSESRYPRVPQPAVLAVVPRDGAVLLVRRANPPDAGKWGFPGGRMALGETLTQAALRELAEETGVSARPLTKGPAAAFASLDVLDHDSVGAVRYHFVLTAVLCRWQDGEGVAADDATDCAWMTPEQIAALGPDAVSDQVERLARMALRIAQTAL